MCGWLAQGRDEGKRDWQGKWARGVRGLCVIRQTWLRATLIDYFSTDTQSKSTIVNIASAEDTRKVQDWFADEGDEEKRYG